MTAAAVLEDLYRAPGLERVDRLGKGLPASVFSWLAHLLALSTKSLAQALGLSERTLRNRTKKLTAHEAELSFRVYRVYRRAAEIFEDQDQAKAWLNTPQRALGERKPLDLLIRDVGEDEVMNVLGAIDDGVYL